MILPARCAVYRRLLGFTVYLVGLNSAPSCQLTDIRKWIPPQPLLQSDRWGGLVSIQGSELAGLKTPSAIMVPVFQFFASSRRMASKLVDRHTQKLQLDSRALGLWVDRPPRGALYCLTCLGLAKRRRTPANVDLAKVRIGAAPSSGAGRRATHAAVLYQ